MFLNLTAVIENSVTAFLIISALSQRSLRLCGDLLGTPKANRRAAENAEEAQRVSEPTENHVAIQIVYFDSLR